MEGCVFLELAIDVIITAVGAVVLIGTTTASTSTTTTNATIWFVYNPFRITFGNQIAHVLHFRF